MVTKLAWLTPVLIASSVLAKIHMVTKPTDSGIPSYVSSVLAKIHMVTKLR